jgi:hypothetical protein
MIRDEPNDESVGNDFKTQEFLRKQPGLDLIVLEKMIVLSKPTDKSLITLMSRAQGEKLMGVWDSTTEELRKDYMEQLGEIIMKMRQVNKFF